MRIGHDFNHGQFRSIAICLVASCALLFPSASIAQIIERDKDIEEPRTETKPSIFADIYSNAYFTTNGLSVSNLPGGLGDKGKSDVIWQKGVGLGAIVPLSGKVVAFGRVDAGHVNFFDSKKLNYFGFSGALGLQAKISEKAFAYGAMTCSSERDAKSFKQYYGACSPTAGILLYLGNVEKAQGVEIGAKGSYSLGSRDRYARFKQLEIYTTIEGGSKLRYEFRPHANAKWYDASPLLAFDGRDRRDYQAGVQLGLMYRHRNFEVGLLADPRVNWSNYEQYRYWDVRVGPTFRWRIGL